MASKKLRQDAWLSEKPLAIVSAGDRFHATEPPNFIDRIHKLLVVSALMIEPSSNILSKSRGLNIHGLKGLRGPRTKKACELLIALPWPYGFKLKPEFERSHKVQSIKAIDGDIDPVDCRRRTRHIDIRKFATQ